MAQEMRTGFGKATGISQLNATGAINMQRSRMIGNALSASGPAETLTAKTSTRRNGM